MPQNGVMRRLCAGVEFETRQGLCPGIALCATYVPKCPMDFVVEYGKIVMYRLCAGYVPKHRKSAWALCPEAFRVLKEAFLESWFAC